MEPNHLELATTQELIAEILSRTTFRGIILWQLEAQKLQDPNASQPFRWEARNLDPTMTLSQVLELLNRGEQT